MIPAIHLSHADSDLTMIYSHGNSTDIGRLYNFALDMATQLKISILLYEYSGFGISEGKPSEKAMECDIYAAYNYLAQETPKETIILLGSSIGSYPTCTLASQKKLAGVILQSPLTSALSLLYKTVSPDYKFDFFNNIKLVPLIKSPVLVIHGIDDSTIPISHSEELVKLLKNPSEPLWLPNASHDNIETEHRSQFYSRLLEFFAELKTFPPKKIKKEKKPLAKHHRHRSSEVNSKNSTRNILDFTVIHEKKKMNN